MSVDRDERRARALLMAIAEPGDPRLGSLLDDCGAVETVARIGARDPRVPGVAPMWARLAATDADTVLAAAAAVDAELVCPGEPGYPTQLDDLGPGRPYGLWLRGGVDLRVELLRSVSMVGARAATAYGVHVATEFAAALAERGWTVVSGCAFGIDVAAHRGVLAAGGVTVGVLACGIDVAYPQAHRGIIERIAAEGVLLSEVGPGSAPARRLFLTRNRIIAALSRGTVVVEAATRSGASTTARWADELGRVLMAVPGPVTSMLSAGTHALMRDRHALVVTRPCEIVEAVGTLGDDLAPDRARPTRPRDELSPRARQVVEALPARGPVGLEELCRAAGLPAEAVHAALGGLSAGGLVERVDGGWRLSPPAKARR